MQTLIVGSSSDERPARSLICCVTAAVRGKHRTHPTRDCFLASNANTSSVRTEFSRQKERHFRLFRLYRWAWGLAIFPRLQWASPSVKRGFQRGAQSGSAGLDGNVFKWFRIETRIY